MVTNLQIGHTTTSTTVTVAEFDVLQTIQHTLELAKTMKT